MRSRGRPALILIAVVGAALVLAIALVATLQVPPVHETTVSLSATAEDLDVPRAGLVIRVTVAEQQDDLLGLVVRLTPPPRTAFDASWSGDPGAPRATITADAAEWRVAGPIRNGTFAARLLPDQGAEGALRFRGAELAAEIRHAHGTVGARPLPLGGLFGEGGQRRTILPTGLTVLTRERPDTPSVAIRVAVRAGSRDEDDRTCGGSHWLEHALFLGTPSRPDNQAIFKTIGDVGGQINGGTSVDWTDYWNVVPAERFADGLALVSDQVLRSVFDPTRLERERGVVRQEHKLRADTPATRAFDEFQPLVFRSSPVRNNPGTVACLDRIPLSTILEYRNAHYVAQNIVVAVFGDIRHDEAVTAVAKAFATLPAGERTQRPRAPEPVEADLRTSMIGEGTRSAELRLGWPAPGVADDDFAAVVVLQDILGATGRRLSESITDRANLATGVATLYQQYADAGALSIGATLRPDRVDAVTDLILREIRRLRDGEVTDADVQASVRALTGRTTISDETNQAQSTRADAEVAGRNESRQETFARLRAVTAADVRRVARTYFDPAAYSRVVVRP